jgi:glycine/D-amino acid oxidase-like deaminating enzyme
MSQPTIVLGAGLIGVSTAYYLSSPSSSSSSQPGQNIRLIDPSPTLFTSASGFAAGFLSRSWFPAPLRALGELSFDLHTELAQKEGGREKWGWCRARSVSFVEDEDAEEEKERPEDWLMSDDWLAAGVSRAEAAKSELGWKKGSGPEWLRRARGRETRVLSGKGCPSETAQV